MPQPVSRFPSRRSPVLATHGMVATSQPLAAQAGLKVLQTGGNAVDAAIVTAIVLNVVEPASTGAGGDAFALVHIAKEGKVVALNGSGRAPAAANLEELKRKGLNVIPAESPYAVTIPGSVDAWYQLLKKYGTLSWEKALQPAIEYAEKGFPVSPIIARQWQAAASRLKGDREAARVYLPGGKAPRAGEIFMQPDLARTFRALASEGPDIFYDGRIAKAIADCVQRKGGWLDISDLRAHRTTWEDPIAIRFRGVTIYEHPPNGQGLVALLALNIAGAAGFDSLEVSTPKEAMPATPVPTPAASATPSASMVSSSILEWGSVEATHILIEAMKLAFADGFQYIADPEKSRVPVNELLSRGYALKRSNLISPGRAMPPPPPGSIPATSDTVYLSVIDEEGNAVSFINSLYYGFGVGIVVPGTGICLQNRGCLFELDPQHPNSLAPGKRPYHTIIPALAARDQKLWLSFGVMGGFMQPQGHVQVITNLLNFDMGYQEALDAPRWRVDRDGTVALEPGFPSNLRSQLAQRGHKLAPEPPAFSDGFGGGQIIAREGKALWGASDPRKDGCAVGW